MNQSAIKSFRECWRFAPLAVLALGLYAALPSTAIFPEEYNAFQARINWHPAFLSWWDLILAGAIVGTWFSRRLSVRPAAVGYLCLCLVAIMISLVAGPASEGLEPVIDGAVHWLRFSLVFCFALALSRRLGSRAAESLLVFLFVILCGTAVAVYSLQFGVFNRIYASAMTVASFSQVAVVVLFLALFRKHYRLLAFSLLFLTLTFGLTSLTLFLALCSLYVSTSRHFSPRQRVASFLVLGLTLTGAYFYTVTSGQFEVVYDSLKTASPETLHGRTDIWTYGLELLDRGSIGLLGVGYNETPELLKGVRFRTDFNMSTQVPHFHSILFEFGLGMGVLALIFLCPLILRVIQTWRDQCHPASLIFTFFLICQSLDYSLYRPKEVIMWALMLGIAEGQRQWLEKGRRTAGATEPVAVPVTVEGVLRGPAIARPTAVEPSYPG